jgi:hypothetical protein
MTVEWREASLEWLFPYQERCLHHHALQLLEKQNTSAMAPCVVGDLGGNMEKRTQQVKTGRRAGPGLGQKDKLGEGI